LLLGLGSGQAGGEVSVRPRQRASMEGLRPTLRDRRGRTDGESPSIRKDLILVDGILGASIHDGGQIKIGPDGKL